MKFSCPNCSEEISLSDTQCACGFSLTLGSLVKFYFKRLGEGVRQRAFFQCPTCRKPALLTATTCPHCHSPITVKGAVDVVAAPVRRRWYSFLSNATPATAQCIQWGYLLASGACLWWLLSYSEAHAPEHWFGQVVLSVVYLAVISLLVRMITPRPMVHAISQRASWRTKLALVSNYLTLLLLLQILIGVWWGRALTVVGLFAVTCLGLWLFRLLSAMLNGDEGRRVFDPSEPQGRSGRYD